MISFGGGGFLEPIFHRHQRTAVYHFLIFNKEKLSSALQKDKWICFYRIFLSIFHQMYYSSYPILEIINKVSSLISHQLDPAQTQHPLKSLLVANKNLIAKTNTKTKTRNMYMCSAYHIFIQSSLASIFKLSKFFNWSQIKIQNH